MPFFAMKVLDQVLLEDALKVKVHLFLIASTHSGTTAAMLVLNVTMDILSLPLENVSKMIYLKVVPHSIWVTIDHIQPHVLFVTTERDIILTFWMESLAVSVAVRK
jgi:hypothetical protein